MTLGEIKPFISESMVKLWPDLHSSESFIKVDGCMINNLFTKDTKDDDETIAKMSTGILEGHCVQVLRPEIKINICGVSIDLKISKLLKVKALKQMIFSHEQLPRAVKGKLNKTSQSVISLNQITLQNHQFIQSFDFTKHVFQMEYPCVELGIVENFVRIYSLLQEMQQQPSILNVD